MLFGIGRTCNFGDYNGKSKNSQTLNRVSFGCTKSNINLRIAGFLIAKMTQKIF